MAQCDVYSNPGASRDHTPFLLDVQADLLRDLDTRVVVPLVRAELFGRRIERLHPLFGIDGESVVMATHLIAAIGKNGLGPFRLNLAEHRYTIVDAVDMVLSGI